MIVLPWLSIFMFLVVGGIHVLQKYGYFRHGMIAYVLRETPLVLFLHLTAQFYVFGGIILYAFCKNSVENFSKAVDKEIEQLWGTIDDNIEPQNSCVIYYVFGIFSMEVVLFGFLSTFWCLYECTAMHRFIINVINNNATAR